MKFCLDDGALLVEELAPTRLGSGADATLHLSGPPPTQSATPSQPSTMTSIGFQPAGGVSPGSQIPADRSAQPGRGWLWLVIALIIGGSGIAIALIVMRGRQQGSALVSPAATSVASPTPTPNGTESASPRNESNGAANAPDTGQVNRQKEKPTPSKQPTPFAKATPAKAEAKEQSSPPANPAPRTTISGGVLNGKAVRLVTPSYPAIARSVHASGTVTVQVLIGEDGNVISARAVSGHPLLQPSAVTAARASKFSPARLSGQPVKVSGVITYNFQEQ